MSSRAEELFRSFQNPSSIHALVGSTEDLHLECKVWPPDDSDAQRVIAKAACGFANADGGVIIVGLRAKSEPDKDKPDQIQDAELVSDTGRVKSRIQDLIGQVVEPGIAGVQVTGVNDPPVSTSGFVVVLIPATDGLPCRSRKDWKFYQRISSGTYPMEYFQLADMFGRRRRPALELHLEDTNQCGDWAPGVPSRVFVVGIKNSGRAIARFPCLRIRRPYGDFRVNSYGIDGNYGFGLPERPSDGEWRIFGGGADHIIYRGKR